MIHVALKIETGDHGAPLKVGINKNSQRSLQETDNGDDLMKDISEFAKTFVDLEADAIPPNDDDNEYHWENISFEGIKRLNEDQQPLDGYEEMVKLAKKFTRLSGEEYLAEKAVLPISQISTPILRPLPDEAGQSNDAARAMECIKRLADNYCFRVTKDKRNLYVYDVNTGIYKLLTLDGDPLKSDFAYFLYGCDIVNNIFCGIAPSVMRHMYAILCAYRGIALEMSDVDSDKVVLKNGVYDLFEMTLTDHSPGICSTVNVEANYIDNPVLSKPVEEFFRNLGGDEDGYDQLFAALGFAISNYRHLQKAVYIYGPSGNGKSTLSNFIKKILPWGSVHGLSAKDLASKFNVINLENAHVNIATDMVQERMTATQVGRLKQIVASDYFEAEAKGKQAKTISSQAFMVFISNFLPGIRKKDDPEGAILRRIWPIQTGPSIPEEKRCPHMLKLLLDDADAIVSIALKTTSKFLNEKRNPSTIAEEEFYEMSDSTPEDFVQTFYETYIVRTDNEKDALPLGLLYQKYKDIYEKNVSIGTTRNAFTRYLKAAVNDRRVFKKTTYAEGKSPVSSMIGFVLKDESGTMVENSIHTENIEEVDTYEWGGGW